MFAIEVHDLELMNGIYKKCLNRFKEDSENNKKFLSIITTSLPLLNKFYPDYVTKFSSDTNMITDSINYRIENLSTSHLYSFPNNIKIVNLISSISWTKYTYKLDYMHYNSQILISLYFAIEVLIFYLTLPISFPIFHILNYFHLINEIYIDGFTKHFYKSYDFISKKNEKLKRIITFMVPYVKFVSYPQEYRWW